MFLSAYHLDGDPAELLSAYRRLQASLPPESLELRVCIAREGGITIYDACPSRADFEEFQRNPAFRAALADAGLPAPHLEPLGDVQDAYLREAVRP
jgi:hypothetical protein